jgi:hypothetical protein
MSDVLGQLREIIQNDVGKRGLATDPAENLITACAGDFGSACHSLAGHPTPCLAVVTGFFIPTATPPAGETDGPLGALFLARALVPLGIPVTIATDDFCVRALEVGLAECGLRKAVPIATLPTLAQAKRMGEADYWQHFEERNGIENLTHVLAIERVGPSHADDRCYTMRGRDITEMMSPAHRLFESAQPLTTIGIGDGGNEIGMGKLPRELIARNIPNGGQVACRVATDQLIVAGVSNWGGYALAAGVAHLRGRKLDASLFDSEGERAILDAMVKEGPLVDGVTGKQTATVDGLTWEQYAEVLTRIKPLAA